MNGDITLAALCHCQRASKVISPFIITRPSSVGGGRILRRTLSVCLSVRPVRGSSFVIVYITTVLRANIQNRKTSVFDDRPASTLRTCGIFCFVYICLLTYLLTYILGHVCRTTWRYQIPAPCEHPFSSYVDLEFNGLPAPGNRFRMSAVYTEIEHGIPWGLIRHE